MCNQRPAKGTAAGAPPGGGAGAGGAAWALVDASEVGRLKAVQRFTKQTLERVSLDVDLDAATQQLAPAKPASTEESRNSKRPAAKRDAPRQGTNRNNETAGRRPNKRRRKPDAGSRSEGAPAADRVRRAPRSCRNTPG